MAFFMTIFAKPDDNKNLILPDVLRFCVPSAIMIAGFGLAIYAGFWMLNSGGYLHIDWQNMADIAGLDSIDALLQKYSWGASGVNENEIVARSAMLFFVSTAGILPGSGSCPRTGGSTGASSPSAWWCSCSW